MELWIRSQDKRMLINTKRIDVDDTDIITWDEGKYASEVYCGHYKTQKRALEILDEIQNCITGYVKVDKDLWGENAFPYEVKPTNFYEMPKD